MTLKIEVRLGTGTQKWRDYTGLWDPNPTHLDNCLSTIKRVDNI